MKDKNTTINFMCPKCGSSYFGSAQNNDGTLTRHCHGDETGRCRFKFQDSDDWKYFKRVTVESFETPDEYQKAVEEENDDG